MFDPLPQRQRIRQRTALFKRILRMNVGIGRRRHPGQRRERQPVAHRRIARHEEELAALQTPFLADPAQAARHARGRVPALHRQYESGRLGQPARKGADHAIALFGILDLRIERIDIAGQIALLDEPAGRILEGRHDAIIFDAEELRDAARQRLRLAALLVGEDDRRRARRALQLGLNGAADRIDEIGIAPDRLAVLAPVKRKAPARQALARIPFALAVMQHAARRDAIAHAPDQGVGEGAFRWTDRGRVPFGRFEIVDRDEGRLPAHGQANVPRLEVGVDFFAERVELLPGLVRKGRGDARRFGDPRHAHVEGEIDADAAFDGARDRRRGGVMRRRRDRDMAFGAEHAGGRVHADPARPRQIDLGPGVQIGEIDLRALRSVDRLDVGAKLDQIAGDEARGEAEVAQDLDKRPGRIAARSARRAPASVRASARPAPCGSHSGSPSAGWYSDRRGN